MVSPHRERQWCHPLGGGCFKICARIDAVAEVKQTFTELTLIERCLATSGNRAQGATHTFSLHELAGCGRLARKCGEVRCKVRLDHCERANQQWRSRKALFGEPNCWAQNGGQRQRAEAFV